MKEEQTRERYVNWLATECSCITDEIRYLFDNLPQSEKDAIEKEMDEHYNKQK